ncbi:MAG: hypothetical protein MMC33_007980 [Icmadophila ericetorum]|nr:hypothetical protein [Icmadophila ericetorum]
MALGAFLGLYEKFLLIHMAKLQLSIIGGAQIFIILALAPIAGRLLDAHLHYWVGFVGSILTIIGYLALSFSSKEGLRDQGNYWAIVATTAISGLGQACVFIYGPQNVAQWFPHKKPMAIGIASAGAAAGGLMYPLLFEFLVSRYSFPVGVRILSAIVGVIAVLAVIIGAPNPAVVPRRIDSAWKISTWIDKAAFKNAAFLWYATSLAFIHLGFYALPFYVTIWASNRGLGTPEKTSRGTSEFSGISGFHILWLLSIMNACSMVGRVGSGILARLIKPIAIQASSCAIGGIICIFWWPFAPNAAAVISFCVAYGVLGGSIMGLLASAIAEIIPATGQTFLGHWLGMALCMSALPALAAPVIASALFNSFGEYAVGLWTGSILIIASVCQTIALQQIPCGVECSEKDANESSEIG